MLIRILISFSRYRETRILDTEVWNAERINSIYAILIFDTHCSIKLVSLSYPFERGTKEIFSDWKRRVIWWSNESTWLGKYKFLPSCILRGTNTAGPLVQTRVLDWENCNWGVQRFLDGNSLGELNVENCETHSLHN